MPNPRRPSRRHKAAPPPPSRRCLLEGPPLGPGVEDITWPDQVAPRGRKASSTRKIKPQTSNPSRKHEAAPPGMPFCHPRGAQRWLARACNVEWVPGSHTRTSRAQTAKYQNPTPCLHDGQPGEGERPTPDAPHNGERSPSPGNLPPLPQNAMSSRACKQRGHCRVPLPAQRHPQHLGSGLRLPAPRTASRGRVSAYPKKPLTKARGT